MTRFGWRLTAGVLVVLAGLGWSFRNTLGGWFGIGSQDPHAEHVHTHEAGDTDYWTCPMHLSVKAKEAGPCPICGMDLTPVPKVSGLVQTEAEVAHWTCPMHPSVKADEAGPCPICGMDLTPVPVVQTTGEIAGSNALTPHPVSQGMPGFISLTPWQQQLIGVTTATVEKRSVSGSVRTVGRVDYDETQLTDVNLKITGWIRKLYVDYTGRPVKQGEALFTLYSPELLSSQEEYLLALRAVKKLEGVRGKGEAVEAQSEVREEAVARTKTVLASAKQRLLLWDLSETQIQELAKNGKSQTTMTIYAPASGFVVDKMAVEGMFVRPEMRLYRIASLDAVWVYADVYEYELPAVQEGQEATISLSYQPDRTFEGRVDYIYPNLDPKTRTAKIRLKVPNPRLDLRPEMYVNVTLETDRGERLAMPESAVLFSGKRRVVFVDLGRGRFQPREVRLGTRMGDYYQVLAGLKEGDRVVTSANFLLDSESRLKNVMAGMVSDNPQEEE